MQLSWFLPIVKSLGCRDRVILERFGQHEWPRACEKVAKVLCRRQLLPNSSTVAPYCAGARRDHMILLDAALSASGDIVLMHYRVKVDFLQRMA